MTHLWEVEHPYYCSTTNDGMEDYESWQNMRESWDAYDGELNMLVRWDWVKPNPDDWDEDDPDRPTRDYLELYFLLQRKGRINGSRCPITEADEDSVREWLLARSIDLRRVWAPLVLDAGDGGAQ